MEHRKLRKQALIRKATQALRDDERVTPPPSFTRLKTNTAIAAAGLAKKPGQHYWGSVPGHVFGQR